MARPAFLIALAVLLFPGRSTEGASLAQQLASGDRTLIPKVLETLRTERKAVIRALTSRVTRARAERDAETLVNCVLALGDIRAVGAAGPVAKCTPLLAIGLLPPGKPVVTSSERSPRKRWPAATALSNMGLEGVRAILKELADPKRNPNHLLVPALIVTSAVLGDFSVDYIARMRERAKGELERERLAQLEAKLRKAYE